MTPAKNAVEDANFLILSISFSLFLFPKMDSMRSRQKPDPREHFRCKTLAHLNFIPISLRIKGNGNQEQSSSLILYYKIVTQFVAVFFITYNLLLEYSQVRYNYILRENIVGLYGASTLT